MSDKNRVNDDELHLNNEVHQYENQGHDIQGHDEDRLPWLEAVEPDADHEAHARSRTTSVLLAGAGALALLIGGLWWMNSQTPPAKGGDGKLIAAAEGDYKAKPADAGGMKVEGQGDASAATAQGAVGNGKIDVNGQTEVPVKPVILPAKPAVAEAAKPNTTAKIADVREVTPKPAPMAAAAGAVAAVAGAAATPIAPGSGLIQLGAYGSETSAKQGWGEMKTKYAFLAPLTDSIVPASVGGATVYRLRAAAGAAAAETCAKIKAAGGNCIIAH
jgi:hypothetical protein